MHNTMQQIYKPHTGTGWVDTHRQHGQGIKAWWEFCGFHLLLCS
jgi:hypothetical protein